MKQEKQVSLKEHIEKVTTPIYAKALNIPQEELSNSMTTSTPYKSNGFRYLFRPNNYRLKIEVKEKTNSTIEKIKSAIVTTNEIEYKKKELSSSDLNRLHRQARRIMEQHIGRKLSIFEVVHHKDGNPENNDITNLVIMTPEDHTSLHQAGRRKGEKPKLPITENKKLRFNYTEHTKIISIKNYKPGITIQYGRSTLTAIYSCPLINGNKQVHLIEGNTIDSINARIDEIKEDIEKRLTDTLTEFSKRFNLSIPFKRPSWVRHENWIKGDEFIDRIPRECIIHDTVGKKVYAEGWEFTGGKGQEPTAHIKNYIKSRAIEDIAPEIAESINKFGAMLTGNLNLISQLANMNIEVTKLRKDVTKIQRHRTPKKSLNKDIRKWL